MQREALLEKVRREQSSGLSTRVCLWPRCLVGEFYGETSVFGMLYGRQHGFILRKQGLNSLTSDI